jgi:hypothetical protein
MLASAIPTKFPIPWGNSAGGSFIRPIPVASQIGIQPGAASLTDGFPPLNFLPDGSGGIPSFGQDENGILKQITQWCQWVGAGGPIAYDPTFSAAIGGYPKGALLADSTTLGGFWVSTVDNNTSDPDTGGANWLAVGLSQMLAGDVSGPLGATVLGNGKVTTAKIANSAVTNTLLANMPSATIKANITGGPAPPTDATVSQILSMLNIGMGGSKATPGYMLVPGGWILQWTTFSLGAGTGSTVNVTWPITFPTAVLPQGFILVDHAADQQIGTNSVTTTGAQVQKGNMDFTARSGLVAALGW